MELPKTHVSITFLMSQKNRPEWSVLKNRAPSTPRPTMQAISFVSRTTMAVFDLMSSYFDFPESKDLCAYSGLVSITLSGRWERELCSFLCRSATWSPCVFLIDSKAGSQHSIINTTANIYTNEITMLSGASSSTFQFLNINLFSIVKGTPNFGGPLKYVFTLLDVWESRFISLTLYGVSCHKRNQWNRETIMK